MKTDSKIYVAGHSGTAGSAILSRLKELGYNNLILKSHIELDLTNQNAVREFFEREQPEYVFFAAAKLSHLGVRDPADVLYANLVMQSNVFHNAYLSNVKKLIFFGSAWMYPKSVANPIKEDFLLKAELDYIAEPYAVSKIAGLKMADAYNMQYGTNFICVALTNLYGKTKDFDFKTAKVLPAMLRKIHLGNLLIKKQYDEICKDLKIPDIDAAKIYLKDNGISEFSVQLWGSGRPRREFIFSDDLADSCIYIMQNLNFKDLYDKDEKNIRNTHINIGTGYDVSIKELAELIKKVVCYDGELEFDTSKPDSSMDRMLDCSKIHSLGWRHKIDLEDGIRILYDWYKKNN